MFDDFEKAIQSVQAAEKLAPAGTHEHDQYVKAALAGAWPIIQAFYMVHVRTRPLAPLGASRNHPYGNHLGSAFCPICNPPQNPTVPL